MKNVYALNRLRALEKRRNKPAVNSARVIAKWRDIYWTETFQHVCGFKLLSGATSPNFPRQQNLQRQIALPGFFYDIFLYTLTCKRYNNICNKKKFLHLTKTGRCMNGSVMFIYNLGQLYFLFFFATQRFFLSYISFQNKSNKKTYLL